MAALRSSSMTMRRFARPALPALRIQPLAGRLQRRSLASHQDVTYPQVPYEKAENVGEKKFSQFDVAGKVFVVTGAGCPPPNFQSRYHGFVPKANVTTGGGRGLGLCMAEGLVEAGGRVHCLDRLPEPPKSFQEAQERLNSPDGGDLVYHRVDVTDEGPLQKCIEDIAAERKRLDGLVAGRASS